MVPLPALLVPAPRCGPFGPCKGGGCGVLITESEKLWLLWWGRSCLDVLAGRAGKRGPPTDGF